MFFPFLPCCFSFSCLVGCDKSADPGFISIITITITSFFFSSLPHSGLIETRPTPPDPKIKPNSNPNRIKLEPKTDPDNTLNLINPGASHAPLILILIKTSILPGVVCSGCLFYAWDWDWDDRTISIPLIGIASHHPQTQIEILPALVPTRLHRFGSDRTGSDWVSDWTGLDWDLDRDHTG